MGTQAGLVVTCYYSNSGNPMSHSVLDIELCSVGIVHVSLAPSELLDHEEPRRDEQLLFISADSCVQASRS